MMILQADTALSWFERALQQPAGSFAFVFAIIVALVAAAIFLTRHTTKYACHRAEDREKVGGVVTHIDEIRRDLAYIKGNIDLISRNNSQNAFTKSQSPINLTDQGKEVAKRLGLEEMIVRNWDAIMRLIGCDLDEKNAYDIQQFFIETASVAPEKLITPEDLDKIKSDAFKTGKTLFAYGSLIGVMIRNHYFHLKGIDIDDIDKHDPNK